MRFLHVRNKVFNNKVGDYVLAPKGGMTIAYTSNKHVVTLATAVVSERDCYCKKTGRDLAKVRFEEGMTVMLPIPKGSRWNVGRYLTGLFSQYVE